VLFLPFPYQYIVFKIFIQPRKCNFFYFFALLFQTPVIWAFQPYSDSLIKTPKHILYQEKHQICIKTDSKTAKISKYCVKYLNIDYILMYCKK